MTKISSMPKLTAFLFCCVAASAVSAGTIKKWTDENGVVHYSDAPPAKGQDIESIHIDGSSGLEGNPGSSIDASESEDTKCMEYRTQYNKVVDEHNEIRTESIRVSTLEEHYEYKQKMAELRNKLTILQKQNPTCGKTPTPSATRKPKTSGMEFRTINHCDVNNVCYDNKGNFYRQDAAGNIRSNDGRACQQDRVQGTIICPP
jgi:hypothetical protein